MYVGRIDDNVVIWISVEVVKTCWTTTHFPWPPPDSLETCFRKYEIGQPLPFTIAVHVDEKNQIEENITKIHKIHSK